MGLQLSVLLGCIGAVELIACLKHVTVCVLNVNNEESSSCSIDYFHRPKVFDDGFVLLDKPPLNKRPQNKSCKKIEAILKRNRSDPDILCIGPVTADEYVRVPSPLAFGVDDIEIFGKSSDACSSFLESSNESSMIMSQKSNDACLTVPPARCARSSTDVSSLADDVDAAAAKNKLAVPKKLARRSRTPEARLGFDDYGQNVEIAEKSQPKKKSTRTVMTQSKRTFRPKSDLMKSAENLASSRRLTKRQREPERCKSEIQLRPVRDEWTNTSPYNSDTNSCAALRSTSKPNISVLIQTSFDDKARYSESCKAQNVCSNCRCQKSPAKQPGACSNVEKKQTPLKVSSFEEASDDYYSKVVQLMRKRKKDAEENYGKSPIESNESYDDEYLDANEGAPTSTDAAIQFNIPDHSANQSFWVG
ncbi:hypothetical protein TKK_0010875 [Trichogramma kaykai]